jgi:uncharacterized membrane protein
MTDAPGAPPSRRRWVLVALTVSLAVNLFLLGVIAGHMHHRHPPPTMRERFEHIVGSLGLDDSQKGAFQQFVTVMRQHGPAMRAANAAAWAKIGDPATTPDQIGTLLDGTVKARTGFQQEMAVALTRFLSSLTPQQRATFIEDARRPNHHGPQ